ncbi:MAG: hypothetical protein NWE93_07795 [Candidatus Bathyarchaeota archaeon]|nr:hypothetical protein [Candidatus Bathyarchaeota archaeon]
MTSADNDALEGLTLQVYLYVVSQGKPTGPREVTKGAKLSSPSVAYRHLQKLEDLGYLAKNEFGEYLVQKKAHLRDMIWLGHRLVPKMWVYALAFLAGLLVEFVILAVHFSYETPEFKVFFLLLTLVTGLAFAVFAVEGALARRRRRGGPE